MADPKPLIHIAIFFTWMMLVAAVSGAVCIVMVMVLWSYITRGCVC